MKDKIQQFNDAVYELNKCVKNPRQIEAAKFVAESADDVIRQCEKDNQTAENIIESREREIALLQKDIAVMLTEDGGLRTELWGLRRKDFNTDAAMREAVSLAETIHRVHFKYDSPDFQILDTLRGVLSQVDNMVAGISNDLVKLQGEKLKHGWTLCSHEKPEPETAVLGCCLSVHTGERWVEAVCYDDEDCEFRTLIEGKTVRVESWKIYPPIYIN